MNNEQRSEFKFVDIRLIPLDCAHIYGPVCQFFYLAKKKFSHNAPAEDSEDLLKDM
jgi:hypothetical protein